MTQFDIYRRDGQIDGTNWKEITHWVEPVMPDERKMTKVYFKRRKKDGLEVATLNRHKASR